MKVLPLFHRSRFFNPSFFIASLFLLAALIRLYVAYTNYGTHDVEASHIVVERFWRGENIYQYEDRSNVLPLRVFLDAGMIYLARTFAWPSHFLVVWPAIIADLLLAGLLFIFLRKILHQNITKATFWLLLFLFNPVTILVSAYHGQNVPGYMLFIVLAIYFLRVIRFNQNRLVASGIFFGMALGFKIMPLLVLPFFLFKITGFRDRLIFLAAVSIPVGLLFLCYPPALAEPALLLQRLFLYKTGGGFFGAGAFLQLLSSQSGLPIFGVVLSWLYRFDIILVILVQIFVLWRYQKQPLERQMFYFLLIFFALTGSFAVQYTYWLIPFLILNLSGWIVPYSLAAFIYLMAFYRQHFVIRSLEAGLTLELLPAWALDLYSRREEFADLERKSSLWVWFVLLLMLAKQGGVLSYLKKATQSFVKLTSVLLVWCGKTVGQGTKRLEQGLVFLGQKANFTLFIILFLAFVLRFFGIWDLTLFKGDQGRDAIWIYDLLIKHRLLLGGTPSSLGNIDLGPAYYYLMAPLAFLFQNQPWATPIGVAFFGWLSVLAFYHLARQLLTPGAALLGTLLYVTSAETIYFQRFAWSPNLLSLFVILFWWGMLIFGRGQKKGLIMAALAAGMASQMHLTGFILPLAGLLYLWLIKYKPARKDLFIYCLALLAIVLVNVAFLIYQFNHRLIFIRGALKMIKTLFWGPQAQLLSLPITTHMSRNIASWGAFVTRSLFGQEHVLTGLTLLVTGLGHLARSARQSEFGPLVWAWLIAAAPFYLLYPGDLFPHYFLLLLPLPFLLTAFLAESFVIKAKRTPYVLGILMSLVILMNLSMTLRDFWIYAQGEFNPKYGPTLKEISQVGTAVLAQKETGKPFALFVSDGLHIVDDGGYRYVFFIRHNLREGATEDYLARGQVALLNFVIAEPKDVLPEYGKEAVIERTLGQPQGVWEIIKEEEIGNLALFSIRLRTKE